MTNYGEAVDTNERRYFIRTRLDFPFEARTMADLIDYCKRLEDEFICHVDKLKFALMYVPTEDGEFTFPDGDSWEASACDEDTLNFARVMEELGELCHSFLKQEQGIRLEEDHRDKMADAVADIVIFLADFCEREGFLFQGLMETVLPKVLKRDWVAHREMYTADEEEAVSS
jgi:NTP pyrophosphatase (non-canonical NTP hydrolase)